MDIDLDPLDDIFADEGVKNTRPVGKFQPKAKAKFRPTKKDSAAPSVSSSTIVTTAAAAELSGPVETGNPPENCPDVLFNDKETGGASIEKSVPENVDIFIGLEALDGILPQNNAEIVTEDTATLSQVSSPDNAEAHILPVHASVEDANYTCKGDDVRTCPELSAGPDLLTAGESIVSSGDEHGQMHDGELNTEELDIMDSINMSELTAKSEQRRGKFLPKPKRRRLQKEIYEANEPVPRSLGSESVQPESNYAEKDSVLTFQQDDMLDLSDLGFSHSLPTEVTPEVPLTGELVNHMQASEMDSGIHLDNVPEIPAKLVSCRATTGRSKTQPPPAASTQQKETSTSGEDNERRRSLRPRKSNSNLCELDDEADEEVLACGEMPNKIPNNSAIEDVNVFDEEFQPENEPQKQKIKRKPKTLDDGGKEKSARKRKKAKEALENGADAKRKKFSHSTRRRRVDKTLLETPEDEIDYHKVSLRYLILLAEHRERQVKKDEATAGGATTVKQSNGNSSSHYNVDETRQNGEDNDGQGSPVMEDTTVYFNYQTHMDKTPSTRWSKQETELFYEAVGQFGTDLSMIQQLFPDRSRRQVKLKYKKEERQHPLRLHEALANRLKDHSYFQKVIERLQKIAAEENQNGNDDDPIDLTANEVDEGASNVDNEEREDEQIEEEEGKGDAAANESEVQSSSNFDDDDDDLFMWSQYKSDT